MEKGGCLGNRPFFVPETDVLVDLVVSTLTTLVLGDGRALSAAGS